MGLVSLLLAALIGAVLATLFVRAFDQRRSAPADPPARPRAMEGRWDAVSQELERSRRYERPFALIRLPAASFDSPGAPEDDAIGAVVGALRTIDFAWVDEGGMHILLPESRREEGAACIRRLTEVAPSLAKSDAQLAVFPEDGVTRGALFSQLSGEVETLPARTDLPSSARAVGDLPSASQVAS